MMSVGEKSETSASGGSESEESESSSMRARWDIVGEVGQSLTPGWKFWGRKLIQRFLIGRLGSQNKVFRGNPN